METIGNLWMWVGFTGIVMVMLAVDLFVVGSGKKHRVSMREAATWSGIWVGVSFVFAGALWWYLDGAAGRAAANETALAFVTGYLIEKSLAVDNVFVWLMLFSSSGMQAICYLFDAEIINAENICHGKTSKINHDNKTIFKNIPQEFEAMRYHSLIVREDCLPDELEISAKALTGVIMGVRHKVYSLEGIQFHPESILTPFGNRIIKNWLNL